MNFTVVVFSEVRSDDFPSGLLKNYRGQGILVYKKFRIVFLC
jgi:hypothetical protein